ncbi:MAG: PEP/pyruvate-binding domain-containing protein [Crocinitomicaceae bacterium]
MSILRSTNDEIRKLSSSELGGKGFHLVRLIENDFNVPPFLVLTNQLLSTILKEIDLSSISSEMPKKLMISSLEQVQQSILNYEFSSEQAGVVLKEFDDFLGSASFVSVRSSGGAEDGENTSFAGQHSTFLFVKREDVLERVKACFASAWNYGAISYRMKQGIPLDEFDFAVILQKMVFATKSGIGFSMNPSGNLTDAVIVAGYGVGEGVVSDEVESDTYLINRQNLKVSKTINLKSHQMMYVEGAGLAKQAVPSEFKEDSALKDQELEIVRENLFKAEKMLDGIADIEFCFDEAGEFFMLQTRPVTSIDLKKVKMLDNTNIVESYPGISLPLTFSFARHAYEKAFQGASKAFWISNGTREKIDGMFRDLLGYHQGRIYYRLDNWYKMITLVFSSKKSIESWEKAVGLKRPPSNELKLSFGNKLKVYASTVWRIINYKRGNRRFYELFHEHYTALREIDLTTLELNELSDTMDESASSFFEFWYLTLINDLMTFKSFDWVQKGIKRRNLGSEDLANDLISGMHESESERSILEVRLLKEAILNDETLTELFKADSEEIWKTLSENDFGGFSKYISQHIDRFGDRTLAELKLENSSFRREPWRFIDLLKGQLKSEVRLKEYQKKLREQEAERSQLLAKNHKWWSPRSHFFKFAIRMAAYGTKNREDMRFCRTRIYGAVKDIYVEIGTRFRASGLILEVDDVFYLTSEEIRQVCKNASGTDLKVLIEQRRADLERDESVQLPDRIIYTEAPPTFRSRKRSVSNTTSQLEGIAVSKGIVRAEAVVISNPSYDLDVSGKIIITEITDPGWVFLMSQAAGLISQKGSLLSHTAIVGREMGIPVIVSVEDVTQLVQSGDVIEMDGQRGTIEVIKRSN